jgi:hypothetical protein
VRVENSQRENARVAPPAAPPPGRLEAIAIVIDHPTRHEAQPAGRGLESAPGATGVGPQVLVNDVVVRDVDQVLVDQADDAGGRDGQLHDVVAVDDWHAMAAACTKCDGSGILKLARGRRVTCPSCSPPIFAL